MLEEILLEETLKSLSVNGIFVVSVIMGLATLASFLVKKKSEPVKLTLFIAIVVPSVALTLLMSGSTIYINTISETGGPVHWHADFEIWKCGESIDLLDPTGIENRIGTSVLHEHNDFRLHVEGTVIKKSDVSLGEFFSVIGGSLSDTAMSVPTNDGIVEVKEGDTCDGRPARLQAFVYKVTNPDDLKNWKFEQIKLDDIDGYILSPFSTIPPGDCVIFEFGEEKQRTDEMCETVKVAIDRGEMRGS